MGSKGDGKTSRNPRAAAKKTLLTRSNKIRCRHCEGDILTKIIA